MGGGARILETVYMEDGDVASREEAGGEGRKGAAGFHMEPRYATSFTGRGGRGNYTFKVCS